MENFTSGDDVTTQPQATSNCVAEEVIVLADNVDTNVPKPNNGAVKEVIIISDEVSTKTTTSSALEPISEAEEVMILSTIDAYEGGKHLTELVKSNNEMENDPLLLVNEAHTNTTNNQLMHQPQLTWSESNADDAIIGQDADMVVEKEVTIGAKPKGKNARNHCQTCAALNCKNNRHDNPDISFFRFPKDANMSRKWVVNTRRQELMSRSTKQLFVGSVLCSTHFEASQFTNKDKRNRLLKTAVPTLFNFLKPPIKLIASRPHFDNQEESAAEDVALSNAKPSTFKEYTKIDHCSYKKCKNNQLDNPSMNFFRFPQDSDLSKRWVVNCRREDLMRRNSEQLLANVLCCKHFEDSQFTDGHLKNYLKADAVPTLFDVPNPLVPSRPKLKADSSASVPLPRKKTKTQVKEDQEYVSSLLAERGRVGRPRREPLPQRPVEPCAIQPKPALVTVVTTTASAFINAANGFVKGSSPYSGIPHMDHHAEEPPGNFDVHPENPTGNVIGGILPENIVKQISHFFQSLCSNNDLTFNMSVQFTGNIFMTVDNCQTFDFALQENLVKMNNSSLLCQSNTSHSSRLLKKEQPQFLEDHMYGLTPSNTVLSRPLDVTAGDTADDLDDTALFTEISSETLDDVIPAYSGLPDQHLTDQNICAVCGDDASGKLNGAPSCDDCKRFFSETIRENVTYDCQFTTNTILSKQCVIDKTQKNKCQYCRYVKCINLGVSKEACTSNINSRVPRRQEEKRMFRRLPVIAKATGVSKLKPLDDETSTKAREILKAESVKLARRNAKRRQRAILKANMPVAVLECNTCGKVFNNKREMGVHLRIHSKEYRRNFKCEICHEKYKSRLELNEHVRDNHGLCWRCDICNAGFFYSYSLQRHKQYMHTETEKVLCDLCGKELKNEMMLRNHKASMHCNREKVKSYKCSVCSKEFKLPSRLKLHERIHSDSKPFQCELCGKGFSSKTSFDMHMKRHNKVLEFQCKYCPKAFVRKSELMGHTLNIHTPDEKPFVCNICGKAFAINAYLKLHQRSHTGEKPYSCSICSKAFSQKPSLNQHMESKHGIWKRNNKEKQKQVYQCDICHKHLSTKVSLMLHQKVHSDLQPFKCDICERRFKNKISLKAHQAIHTGVKPHECDICHQRFRLAAFLKNHRMTHTGEKPHQCQVCGQRFRQKGDHTKHIKKHASRGECSLVVSTNSNNMAYLMPQVVSQTEIVDATDSLRLLVEASQISP